MSVSPQVSPQVWTRLPWSSQSPVEYRTGLRQAHGNVRRFLSGCRCERCDRPPNRRFRAHLLTANVAAWSTSA